MSTYEETVWCCTTGRGSQLSIVDKIHDELKSFGRFWYQEILDSLNSKQTVIELRSKIYGCALNTTLGSTFGTFG
jgi:hypothetical protein